MSRNRSAAARKKAGKNTGSEAGVKAGPGPLEALEAECGLLREDIAQLQARLEQRVLDATLGQSALEAAHNHQTLTEERAANREAVLGAGLLALAAQRDELAPQLTELAGLARQVSQLKTDLETRDRQLEAAEADLAAAHAEIEAIHNSRSWKITRLLRLAWPGKAKI